MQFYAELSAGEITDPQVKAAYEYWQKVRGGRLMPSRGDIDPIDLKFCLGRTWLIDVVHEPVRRFKCRVDGTQLAHMTGWDLTGRYLDDIKDEVYRNFVRMIYNLVVDRKAPVFIRSAEEWADLGYVTESATLPPRNGCRLMDAAWHTSYVWEVQQHALCPLSDRSCQSNSESVETRAPFDPGRKKRHEQQSCASIFLLHLDRVRLGRDDHALSERVSSRWTLVLKSVDHCVSRRFVPAKEGCDAPRSFSTHGNRNFARAAWTLRRGGSFTSSGH